MSLSLSLPCRHASSLLILSSRALQSALKSGAGFCVGIKSASNVAQIVNGLDDVSDCGSSGLALGILANKRIYREDHWVCTINNEGALKEFSRPRGSRGGYPLAALGSEDLKEKF